MVNPGPGFEDGLTRDEDWGAQLFQAGLEFADNPEPRCPCVLLLDTSKSMSGDEPSSPENPARSLLSIRIRLEFFLLAKLPPI